jgi:hypothetical protein
VRASKWLLFVSTNLSHFRISIPTLLQHTAAHLRAFAGICPLGIARWEWNKNVERDCATIVLHKIGYFGSRSAQNIGAIVTPVKLASHTGGANNHHHVVQ